MGWDFDFVFFGYTESWRAHRRTIHQYPRPQSVVAYHPILATRVKQILKTLFDKPEDPYPQLRKSVAFQNHTPFLQILTGTNRCYSYAGSFPLKLAYGRDDVDTVDPLITRAEEATAMLTSVMFPGARMVNEFPFRKLHSLPNQPH